MSRDRLADAIGHDLDIPCGYIRHTVVGGVAYPVLLAHHASSYARAVAPVSDEAHVAPSTTDGTVLLVPIYRCPCIGSERVSLQRQHGQWTHPVVAYLEYRLPELARVGVSVASTPTLGVTP